MDSFICGNCNQTFRILNEFIRHKKAHEDSSNLSHLEHPLSSVAVINGVTNRVVLRSGKNEGNDSLSNLSSLQAHEQHRSSPPGRYRINKEGHLQKYEEGQQISPPRSYLGKMLSKCHHSLRNLEALKSKAYLSSHTIAVDKYDAESLQKKKDDTIHIFENSDDKVPLGQLILEDSCTDFVRIEITEKARSNGVIVTSSTSGVTVDRTKHLIHDDSSENAINVDEITKPSDLVKLPGVHDLVEKLSATQSEANNIKSDRVEIKSNSNNNFTQITRLKSLNDTQEIKQNLSNNKESKSAENSTTKNIFHRQIKDELIDFGSDNMKCNVEVKSYTNCNDAEKMTEEYNTKTNKETGKCLSLETDGIIENQSQLQITYESSGVVEDGLELNSSDVTYASTPGLYTLLLNADNTFTLVAGEYQSSTVGQYNRIFACHLCKKFALSQVEILNHISVSHPKDLNDVNNCLAEFSSLSATENEYVIEVSDANQFSISSDTRLKTVSNESYDKHVKLAEDGSSQTQEDLKEKPQQKRIIRKKLGRPRKEDRVHVEEAVGKKGFIEEGDCIVCINCRKFFLKRRQYDKHKCHIWKESLDQMEAEDKAQNDSPSVKKDDMDDYDPQNGLHDFGYSFPEDDFEDEWKLNKRYKPKVKIKPKGDEQRKRGRPPKVEVMASKSASTDVPQEDNYKQLDSSLLSCDQEKARKNNLSRDVPVSVISTVATEHSSGANPPLLNSIPTLPVFSNARQQERLHKWISQTDLSFVDRIIDKLCPGDADATHDVEMYRCQECKILFRSLLACRRHCAKHMARKAFTCPDCDFATANVGVLYSHYRNHTQNLYSCNKCDFRARIKAHYRDHLETHNPSRYVCRLCQRPYSTSNSLRSHIYLYHANKDGMKYLWCLRKKNEDRNSKNVVFQCPICSKLFGERSSASRHLASHGPPSVPKVLVKCEVCGIATLSPDTFKKHILQKHKVVYICCLCREPQVTANSLRNHHKSSGCSSSNPGETFKQSILLSFASPGTFPNLFTHKRIGPILQAAAKNTRGRELEDIQLRKSISKQMQDVNYKQIYKLLRDQVQLCPAAAVMNDGHAAVMKIVVDTRSIDENEQEIIPWTQNEQVEEHIEYEYEESFNHTLYHSTEAEHIQYREEVVFPVSDQKQVAYDGNKVSRKASHSSPIYLQDPNCGERDQRVVVISNVGEEQTVVVEDGQMVMTEEERFVVINEESDPKQPINFAKFFVDTS